MSEQREALAEALAHADHCHGLVTRDGIEDACGKPPVAIIDGRGTEDEVYWPACAYHAHRYGRGNGVPLARLLADAEQRGADRADAVRDREFGNLRWMDGHLQGVKDGRAEVAAAVEAGRDAYLDSPNLDRAWVAGWHSATDHHVAKVRAALTTGAADRVRAEEGGDEPRCQYVSPSPWGPTQCALPEGHAERHAYSPSEDR